MPDAPDPTARNLLSREARHEAGKALRNHVPLERHGDFHIDKDRDPLPVLTAGDAVRVRALVPERYKRMAQSPFAFYRGGAALMAHDLTLMPRIGLPVQACGDAHLMNFGVFSSPEGNVLFDINDFDETYPGVDFIVDLKRLVASAAVAAQAAGMSDKAAEALARSTAAAYREFMSFLGGRSPLEVWETRMDLKDQLTGLGNADLQTKMLKKMLKAEKKGDTAKEQPGVTKDGMRFEDKPPMIFHKLPDGTKVRHVLADAARRFYEATLAPERAALLNAYAVRDVAFKVVGVGSVGTFCAIGLWTTADGDQMVLQLKQAAQSAIAGLAPGTLVAEHQGKRVVLGQRAMQAAPDPFLGWTQDDSGRQYYVRQLKNRRLAALGEGLETKALPAYATLCGRTLARAHARIGDPAMIAGYIGGSDALDAALAGFAMAYASQTVLDHAKLVASGLGKVG